MSIETVTEHGFESRDVLKAALIRRDDRTRRAVVHHKVSEWLVARISDKPNGPWPRALRLSPARLERAIRLWLPLTVHPEDFDWVFSLVDEHNVECITIWFRGRRSRIVRRVPCQLRKRRVACRNVFGKLGGRQSAQSGDQLGMLGFRGEVDPFVAIGFCIV